MVEVTDGSGHDAPFIGACALDTAAAQVLLGSWRDDEVGRLCSLGKHAACCIFVELCLSRCLLSWHSHFAPCK